MESSAVQGKEEEAKKKPIPKPNNMFDIPTTLNDFFKWWCVFLRPFVNLTNKEIDVVASLLKQRYELSKSILDPAILDSQLMSADTKGKVIKECNITLQHFYVMTKNLREKNIITETGINRKLIPNIRETDNGKFQLLIRFIQSER